MTTTNGKKRQIEAVKDETPELTSEAAEAPAPAAADNLPQLLPNFAWLKDTASMMHQQTAHLLASGEQMVNGLRRHLADLVEEEQRMEAERLLAIDNINFAHRVRLERIFAKRDDIERMIATYTGVSDKPDTSVTDLVVSDVQPARQQPRKGAFLRILGGGRR